MILSNVMLESEEEMEMMSKACAEHKTLDLFGKEYVVTRFDRWFDSMGGRASCDLTLINRVAPRREPCR